MSFGEDKGVSNPLLEIASRTVEFRHPFLGKGADDPRIVGLPSDVHVLDLAERKIASKVGTKEYGDADRWDGPIVFHGNGSLALQSLDVAKTRKVLLF